MPWRPQTYERDDGSRVYSTTRLAGTGRVTVWVCNDRSRQPVAWPSGARFEFESAESAMAFIDAERPLAGKE